MSKAPTVGEVPFAVTMDHGHLVNIDLLHGGFIKSLQHLSSPQVPRDFNQGRSTLDRKAPARTAAPLGRHASPPSRGTPRSSPDLARRTSGSVRKTSVGVDLHRAQLGRLLQRNG